jgi:hypothetical protein
MSQRRSSFSVFATLGALALLIGCERPPAHDPVTLKAIKAEAHTLMNSHPINADVTKARWPREIASLRPEFVSIDEEGVYITTKAHFDGGWGYFVPRKERHLPEPAERFEDAGQGVYWWHPY